jgi:hypothetical protein
MSRTRYEVVLTLLIIPTYLLYVLLLVGSAFGRCVSHSSFFNSKSPHLLYVLLLLYVAALLLRYNTSRRPVSDTYRPSDGAVQPSGAAACAHSAAPPRPPRRARSFAAARAGQHVRHVVPSDHVRREPRRRRRLRCGRRAAAVKTLCCRAAGGAGPTAAGAEPHHHAAQGGGHVRDPVRRAGPRAPPPALTAPPGQVCRRTARRWARPSPCSCATRTSAAATTARCRRASPTPRASTRARLT